MATGVLRRVARLEGQIREPPMDLSGFSVSELQRIEGFFLRIAEMNDDPGELRALPKRLQRFVLKAMNPA